MLETERADAIEDVGSEEARIGQAVAHQNTAHVWNEIGRRLVALDSCVTLDEPRAAGDNLRFGMRPKNGRDRGKGAGLVKIVGVEQAYDVTTRRRDSLVHGVVDTAVGSRQ